VTIDEVLRALAGSGRGDIAVVGAVARNAWAPPRATTDLDLAVAADSDAIAAVEQALFPLGYRRTREQKVDPSDEVPDIVILRTDEGALKQVDLLVAKTAFEAQALGRAVCIAVGGRPTPVVTAEDLIVYKLIAHRPRDVEDVRAVARTQSRAGRGIDWAHVQRWCDYWEIGDRLERMRDELGQVV